MNIKTLSTISATAFLAVAGQADQVTVNLGDHTGSGSSTSVMYNYLGGLSTSNATAFNASVDGFSFLAYCVDLSAGAATNSSYLANREFVLDAFPGSVGQRLSYIYNNHHSAGLSTTQQAAVQVALWEVRYDNTFNLDSGNFKTMALDASVKAGAQAILNDVMNPMGSVGNAYFYDSTTGSQDIIGPMAPVPEPASLAALGVGAAALLRRRKNRK